MKKILAVLVFLVVAASCHGQAISANGGSIQGTVSDSSGAAIPRALVTISKQDTGYMHTVQTDSAGFYSVGPLNPGDYIVAITVPQFQRLVLKTTVRTGTSTNGDAKLNVGSQETTVEVNAGALQVNTDQAGVQDVLTREEVETLPINGRNFLDLAQLQPGVILQSGQTFDPTKSGYSAISVDGISGRTTRILLDGQDITDETVGTTIINVPTGSVDEFQLNRSTQDVSGEVTSTGQVLVATRSGTNALHGQLFYAFQDYRALFAATTNGFNAPFQRNQFGGNVGGPIVKNKLFFFANSERIKQDEDSSATSSPTFAAITTAYPFIPAPFRDTFSLARLDYNGPRGAHYFTRLFYEDNAAAANSDNLYSIYENRDNVPGIVAGVDFITNRFTHSIRGGYEKFHNMIGDATVGNSSIYNPNNGLSLSDSNDGFFAGPNQLAPQGTFQSDKQLRYDGTWTRGNHTLKYGASLNRILGGGFAAVLTSPLVSFNSNTLLSNCGNVAGSAPCPGDPLNGYTSLQIVYGNGNGAFTERPAFGLPGGGVEDWRSGYYIADTWKALPDLTLIMGLRYSIDTDRANQDLATPTCASIAPGLSLPCSGDQPLFAQFQANLGARVHQPYGNVAPQAGIVFSPGAHKFSVRLGGGMYFESDIFNNTTNARSPVIDANGPYFGTAAMCGGAGTIIALPGGGTLSSVNGLSLAAVCNLPISQAAPYILAVKQIYQGATAAHNSSPNSNYIGNYLSTIIGSPYGAPYRTPYSVQFNGGLQYELVHGTIISVDYLHNGTIHVPLIIDVNHIGSARNLNDAAARNAISATLSACGASSISLATAPGGCPGGSGPSENATIIDFANKGLDSSSIYLSGLPAQAIGLTPATGAAFAGVNPNVGQGNFILPTGQSGYDALQIALKQTKAHPAPGILNSNFQISYSLSRIVSDVGGATSADQFINSAPYDTYDPKSFTGRNSNDHSNELSFGGTFTMKYGLQVGLIGHFFSATPTSLSLPVSGSPGEIFRTDVTGDGTVGDLVPGTLPGDYMHRFTSKTLENLITGYNSSQAGTLTPAGQALVTAGLFTQAQLVALGASKPALAPVPANGALPNSVFRTLDASISYPISLKRIREGITLIPTISMYNAANMANFGGLSGELQTAANSGLPGALNGPNTAAVQNGLRIQRSAGTFDQGAPRSTEFQLKLNF
jgi:Carboxypeptidase regulatory-like domain